MPGVKIIRPVHIFDKRALSARRHFASAGGSNIYRYGHKLAVKVARDDVEFAVKGLAIEAEFLANVGHHPNIVTMCNQGTFHDQAGIQRFYTVLEYFAGGSLDKAIGKQKLAPSIALRICRDIAAALGRVHEQGKVYRDMKPHNIVLARRLPGFSRAVLVDFGIVEDIGHIPPEGQFVGTPGYFYPEAIFANRGIRPADDFYSLSIVLLEMLIGKELCQGASPNEILMENSFLHRKLPHIIEQEHFSPELRQLFMTAFHYDRDAADFGVSQRYQTASEFIGATDRALAS